MALGPTSLRSLSLLIRRSPRRCHSTAPRSSVNPTEVSHFNALASSWWDPQGPSRLLHLMNPLRHDFIVSCQASTHSATISATSSPRKVRYLDIGCGGGIFAESAARLSSDVFVTAIDPSPDVLSVAKTHAAQDPIFYNSPERLRYLNISIEKLPPPATAADGYDVLALWEVIEHVDYPAIFLEECIKHVKPGGWLVLSTIARTWTSWAVTKVMAEDVLGVVPRGTHEWAKYLNEDEVREWFRAKEGWGSGTGEMVSRGCMYVPGIGWKWVEGGEKWGNYFFGVRRDG